jgi:hypothetical protein
VRPERERGAASGVALARACWPSGVSRLMWLLGYRTYNRFGLMVEAMA